MALEQLGAYMGGSNGTGIEDGIAVILATFLLSYGPDAARAACSRLRDGYTLRKLGKLASFV